MPDAPRLCMGVWERVLLVWDGVASYQLDGGVMAHHGFDG